jgi:hypothetical protein
MIKADLAGGAIRDNRKILKSLVTFSKIRSNNQIGLNQRGYHRLSNPPV